jgi:thiamine monophosphate kinase
MEVFNTMQLVANYANNTWARGEINQKNAQNQNSSPKYTQIGYVLAGGDDYELAFTAPPTARAEVQAASREAQTSVTRIGQIESEAGLRLVDASGALVQNQWQSFDHFA